MNVFNEVYYKTLAENERNLKYWRDYLKNLRDLDFSVYSDKLKVPALIPVGNRILFRGEIKHTNEVTVALGQGYFVKCSVTQAEVLKQRRIKDAEEKVEVFQKEKDLLENRLYYSKQTVDDDEAQEILEPYNEEEDKIWREKHKQQIKRLKQEERKNISDKNIANQVTDEELWNRLEELELQEELENETQKLSDKDSTKHSKSIMRPDTEKGKKSKKSHESDKDSKKHSKTIMRHDTEKGKKSKKSKESNKSDISSDIQNVKEDILQKLLDKQHELEHELISTFTEKMNIKTESDLMTRLEELEQLEELEDEMDRLDTLSEKSKSDKSSEESDSENPAIQKIKRSVSFADDNDASETIEITFEHTNVVPNRDKYDPTKGFTKPSDIYEAYPHLFRKKTTIPILKKSKYSTATDEISCGIKTRQMDCAQNELNDDLPECSTIIVKDIVEKSANSVIKESKARPTSLFKLRRQQKKS